MKTSKLKKSNFERKQKGKVAILWVISALWVFSTTDCSEIENPDEEGLFLYAKVENASKFRNVVEVKIMMGDVELAHGKWKDDGFIILLPKTVEPNYLHALINNNREYMTIIDPPPTVSISNENVSVCNACFLGFDKNNNMVTRFYPIEIDEDGNCQDIYYTYVDYDVSILGYTERMNTTLAVTEYDNERFKSINIMLNTFDKITSIYSVKWEKGWNVWCFFRFVNISENTATEKWTTSSSPKWYGAEDMWVKPTEE